MSRPYTSNGVNHESFFFTFLQVVKAKRGNVVTMTAILQKMRTLFQMLLKKKRRVRTWKTKRRTLTLGQVEEVQQRLTSTGPMLVVFLPPLYLFEMWWSDIEGKMTFIDYGHILLTYSDMGNQ